MKRDRRKNLIVAAVLAVAAICFGAAGWLLDEKNFFDAVYRSLQAFTLSDGYAEIGTKDGCVRLLLEAARWIGAFLSFSTIILILWTSLTNWRIERRARNSQGHLTILGDSVFADRVSETISASIAVVQLRGPDQPIDAIGDLIRLPFHGFDNDGLDEAGTARAKRLIVALSDDGATVDLALAAQRRYPALPILARLSDGWLVRNLYDLPGGKTLRAFSESEAAAREIVRRHPLFLLAEDRGQPRIHALLVGDDGWVEAILAEIILSSRTLKLGKPKLTLGVPDADSMQRRLAARYPELGEEAVLDFLSIDAATFMLGDDAMRDADTITAVYCAFEDGARSLTAALALKRQTHRWPGFGAPIFVRVSGDQGLARPIAGSALPAREIVPFGATSDVMGASGLASVGLDSAEREWHEAYLKLHPESEAAVPWDQLNEDYRLSNRRAIAHAYAKLHEAGFDLRPWLATAKPWDELPALAPDQALFHDDAELMHLAELEHERWNADRRLLGWRYGDPKHDGLKHHPCLTDFAKLSAELQHYDVELVQTLDRMLPRKAGGLTRTVAAD